MFGLKMSKSGDLSQLQNTLITFITGIKNDINIKILQKYGFKKCSPE
jgi:hypothetical protein